MPLGQTRLTIIRAVLVELGDEPIFSLDQESAGIDIVNARYDSVVNSLLAAHPWRFASAVSSLARLATAPTNPAWEFAYQLPHDYVTARGILTDAGNRLIRGFGNIDTFQDYDIYGSELWTNEGTVFLSYTRRTNEGEWSDRFTETAILSVAAACAIAVTENPAKSRELNNRLEMTLMASRTHDAQARPTEQFPIDPLTTARV